MSLEGLRAWIGEVERKLGMRTRVFLALTVIAIGIAGASVYLAIDARNSSVSESDVQALQEELEARIDELRATAAPTPPTAAPQSDAQPQDEPGSNPEQEAAPSTEDEEGASGTGGDAEQGKLRDLVEDAG
jgi:hypothetical protein